LDHIGENKIGVKVADEIGTFDSVLLAMPAYRLAELEFPDGERSLSELNEIIYPPVASVVLGFKKDEVAHSLAGFGTLNPEVEKVKTLGTIFSSSLFPGRAPEGCVTLTSYVGGMRSPDLAMQSSEEIVALTVEDLRAIYGIDGEPVFEQVFPYPKAIPQYGVGYGRFRDLMTHCEADHPGIFLAGHCRDGISLADSIVSGARAAERIGGYLDQTF
jgi:oxygen-dependent protoporphyrinogen oxidase